MNTNAFFTLIIILGIIVYVMPSTTAFARGHHNTMAIAVLNILLGWTFIGWVVAMVWASTAIKASAAPLNQNDHLGH